MADLERGERIKAAREALHLTQPAVVELFEARAREAGWESEKPGDHPLSLRGYQEWEAGGGIKWENAKLLAGVLGLEPEYLMSGRDEAGPTPDLSLRDVRDEFRPDVDGVQEQLDRIERQVKASAEEGSAERASMNRELAKQNANLDRQTKILETMEQLLGEIRGLVGVLQGVRVEQAGGQAPYRLPGAPALPSSEQPQTQEEPQTKPATGRAVKGQGRQSSS